MMVGMGKVLLLFIVVPAVELVLLFEVHSHIGPVATVAIIVLTGVLGAGLARRQGLGVLRQVRMEMAQGRLPAGSIVDGAIVLLAGALLITPGILTDAVGFLGLIPVTRRMIKKILWLRIERAIREGRVRVSTRFESQLHPFDAGPIHDVKPEADPHRSLPEPPDEL